MLFLFWLVQDSNAKAGKFGFAVDNTIGATSQPNGWMDNWVDFYRERRIKHQLQLLGRYRCWDVADTLNVASFAAHLPPLPCQIP